MKELLRRAFTLVELLVVLAIIGLLIAILLPAVQMARESSRRAWCLNNLKQLAVASHLFHDVHRKFPPGYLGPRPQAPVPPYVGQWTSVHAFLLPYIEQRPLHERTDTDAANFGNISVYDIERQGTPFWQRPAPWDAAQTSIGLLLCPSDYAPKIERPIVVLHFHYTAPYVTLSAGSFADDRGDVLKRTNYLGSGGYMGVTGVPGSDTFRGVFWNRSEESLATITDGTSNTLLFGEAMGGNQIPKRAYAWFGCGVMASAWGLAPSADNDTRWGWWQFSSQHPGAVNFAFADGACRALTHTIDRNLFIYLSAVQDGQNVSAP